MNGLRIDGLTVTLGRHLVLDRLTLPEVAGGVTAIIGPNGAGKSTLLRAISGLLPSQGKLAWREMDLQSSSRAARAARIAYMPQHLTGRARLTVLESLISALMAGAGWPGRSSAAARDRALTVLERLGLGGLALASLEALSGGQRQMIGLAQAILRDPELLLLDEPTSALDLRHQTRVMAETRRLAQAGTTVVMVLHDLALAARWADRVLVLNSGELAAYGAPREAITAELLASVYGVAARIETCSRGQVHVSVDAIVDAE